MKSEFINQFGIFEYCDLYFSQYLCEYYGIELRDDLYFVFCCLSRSSRLGHICIFLQPEFMENLYWKEKYIENNAPGSLIIHDLLFERIKNINFSRLTIPLVILENKRLYINKYFNLEEFAVKNIQKRSKQKWNFSLESMDLEKYFSNSDDVDQKNAAALALNKKLCFITGGPGTGKTTTVVKILLLHLKFNPNLRIKLAAPTGKAAMRLHDSIALSGTLLLESGVISEAEMSLLPKNATTIHRLLSGLRRDAYHSSKIPCDLLVIDESSMLDLMLFSNVLKMLPADSGLLLLGDPYQLASVEAGALLGDIVHAVTENKDLCHIKNNFIELNKSRRFTSEFGIGAFAKAIKDAALGIKTPEEVLRAVKKDKSGQIYFYEKENYNELIQKQILEYYLPLIEIRDPLISLKKLNQFKILCAHKKGYFGAFNLNEKIKKYLNYKRNEFENELSGMPVLITKNDYNMQLYNGDTGIILSENGSLYVYFPEIENPEKLRKYKKELLPAHELSFAVTVHKSQGSEYESVAFILPDNDSPVLTSELIYTAVSRSKKEIHIYGNKEVLVKTLSKKIERASGISEKL